MHIIYFLLSIFRLLDKEHFETSTSQPTLATSLISQTTQTHLHSPTSFVENEQDVNNLSRQDRRRRIQSLLINPRRR